MDVPPLLRLVPSLFRPRSYVPDVKVPDFRTVDFAALRRAGYSGVVVDKDNCLTLPYRDQLLPHLREPWAELKAAFGPGRVLIVSNSSGTKSDPSGLGAEALHRETGVPVLLHAHKKPLCARDIDDYFAALPPLLPLPPLPADAEARAAHATDKSAVERAVEGLRGGKAAAEEGESTVGGKGIVVIGDRLLTDVLLTGQLAGPSRAKPQVKVSMLSSAPASTAAAVAPGVTPPPPAAPAAAPSPSAAPAAPLEISALPFNLSILHTSLPQKADVRPLRVLETALESLARRRLRRPLSSDLAALRSAGILVPEPAPVPPAPLEGWRKGVALVGQGVGLVLGEAAKGLVRVGRWGFVRAKAEWQDWRVRKREERERAAEAKVREAEEGKEKAPVRPQAQVEVEAVKV